jgi:hypothetical protein
MAMIVETKPAALFNIFNADVTLIAEGNDTAGIVYAGDNPTNQLISEAQSLKVDFSWTVSGIIRQFTAIAYRPAVFLEKMGVGESAADFAVTLNAPISATPFVPQNHNASVIIPAGLTAGLYRLTACLTCKTIPGNVNLPSAGFMDLGFIQVYPNS